uniref:Uncharacterized protein n=1 Tax=Panagrolaimus sp. PS1159 TaxID=55785 RepID=A0AC35GCI6_9BILA
MKQLLLLLLFIAGLSAIEYHGDQRHWTIVDGDGKTNVALHLLNEHVDLFFPSDKSFHDIASDMKLFSPSGNVHCHDTTNTLKFTLLFDDRNHIHGEIKMALDVGGQKIIMLYQKCCCTELSDAYSTVIIEGADKPLENIRLTCFLHADPFQQYGSNATRSPMKVLVNKINIAPRNATTTSTMESNTTIIEYSTTASSTKKDEAESAGFSWWWIIIPVALLIVDVAFAVAFVGIRQHRRNKIPKRKIRVVSKSAERADSIKSKTPGSAPLPLSKSKVEKKPVNQAFDDLSIKSKTKGSK